MKITELKEIQDSFCKYECEWYNCTDELKDGTIIYPCGYCRVGQFVDVLIEDIKDDSRFYE